MEIRKLALKEARYHPLNSCNQRMLFPVVKLREEETFAPWEETTCPAVVVKTEDLVNPSGRTVQPIVERIKNSGGIHPFLNFNGNVILSSIMRDKTIAGLTAESYAQLINILKPNYYLTPDGETYEGKEHSSALEISRVTNETEYLLQHCPKSTPIGLVKGCNVAQVAGHTNKLLSLGIELFAFHTGDFLCRGSKQDINTAARFVKTIRTKVPWMMIYGCGSRVHFNRFWQVDGFVTQSHFVNAYYHQRMIDSTWVHFNGKVTRSTIMSSLSALDELLIELETQPGLMPWMNLENVSATLIEKTRLNKEGI